MSRWQISQGDYYTKYNAYENYLRTNADKLGLSKAQVQEQLGRYAEGLQEKLKFEPQRLQVGREVAQNPAEYGLSRLDKEIQQAQKQLQVLTKDLGNGATSTTYFGTPEQLRKAAPLGNIAPGASQKVTFTKIKEGVNKGKWGVYVDGRLDSVHDTKTKANTSFNAKRAELGQIMPKTSATVAEPKVPVAESAAQAPKTTKPEASQKFTRGDRVRANNLWTTRVRPDLEAQLTPNPLTKGLNTNPDFRGKDFIQQANNAAKQTAQKAPVEAINLKKPYIAPAMVVDELPKVVIPEAIEIAEAAETQPQKVKPSRKERLKEIRNNPEKRARYNKLKLAQNPELKARYERMTKPKGFFGKIANLFKGKGGKVALIGAGIATIAGGVALVKGCEDKAAEPTAAVPEKTTQPSAGVNPTPAQPQIPALPSDEASAENIIQNGDALTDVANRYGVTEAELKELNGDKIKQFKTSDGRVIEGFLVGEDITLPDNSKKVDGLKSKDEAILDYENYLIMNFESIPKTMWNQLCTPEFRRKHNLGEYKKAA